MTSSSAAAAATTATTATAEATKQQQKKQKQQQQKQKKPPARKRNQQRRQHQHHEVCFDERIYRRIVGDDVGPVNSNQAKSINNKRNKNKNNVNINVNNYNCNDDDDNDDDVDDGDSCCNSGGSCSAVPLPVAVRSCWPRLFPTMSSAKKSIRKGVFFVQKQPQKQQQQPQPAQQQRFKGKCDTRVALGDQILRKLLPNSNRHHHRVAAAAAAPTNDSAFGEQPQPQHEQPRFRSRGPSTEDIIARSIGVGQKLQIAYLDRHVAVVIKPHGMPVHKVQAQQEPQPDRGGGNGNGNCGMVVPACDNNSSSNNNNSNISRIVSMHELLLHCLPLWSDARRSGGNHDTTNDIDDYDDDDDEMNDPLRRPAAVHRLDQPTYGLLIVARTRPCARFLGTAFAERSSSSPSCEDGRVLLVKRYRAVVHGRLPPNGGTTASTVGNGDGPSKGSGTFVRSPLGGKACISEYFVVTNLEVPVVVPSDSSQSQSQNASRLFKQEAKAKGDAGADADSVASTEPLLQQETTTPTAVVLLTLVDLILHTGRKHQLRRHMSSLGHPIVGDTRYGRSDIDKSLLSNIALVSSSTTICHSTTSTTTRPPPSAVLPLMLAAVEITFPHPASSTGIHSFEESANSKYCVLAKDSRHHFDASRGTLNVAIDMPESMTSILRNSR